jgi:uncharacterized protein (TIGR03435 family)
MRLALPLAVLIAVPVAAQSPTFEAVSVKPNSSGSRNVSVTTTRGQMMGTNVPVRSLIRQAYRLQDFQIVDAPDWIDVERFDIQARGDDSGGDVFRQRLQRLLADRFGLVARTETRELPVYALIAVRGGERGPQLKATAVTDCNVPNQYCGTSINNRAVRAVKVSMASLATTLSSFVGRTVIDRTGLAGEYDAEFSWTSDPQRPSAPGDDGPSIFTALQEQLGLKLEAGRGPVDVLVVARVERPTED